MPLRTRPALPLVRLFLAPGHEAPAPRRSHPTRVSTFLGPRRRPRRALRDAAAAAIAVGGYVHLCLYRNGFRAIPTIGVGFLLQVIGSTAVAGALVIGRDRLLHVGRMAVHSSAAVRLFGLDLSIGTLVAFGLTRTPMGLFNFRERGLEPAPQALIALAAEVAALALLTTTFVLDHLRPVAVPLRIAERGPSRIGSGRRR